MAIVTCADVTSGLKVGQWNGAGAGATIPGILVDQPIIVYSFNGGVTKWVIKVIMWDVVDVTPKWFEVRGKWIFANYAPVYSAPENTIIGGCVQGTDTGVAYDPTFTTPAGYTNDNGVYKSNGTCDLPVITTQPSNQIRNVGDTLTLAVVATGTTLSYQWRHGSNDIAGATSATYTKPNITTADAGVYTVVITSTCGGGKAPGITATTTVSVTVNPSAIGFSIDFSKTLAVKGDCPCTTAQWYFSQTINVIGDVPNGAWLNSGVKTFVDSGIWFVHAKLPCNDKGDTRKFQVNSTTKDANRLDGIDL